MSSQAEKLIEDLKKKGMTKDQLGDHFGLDINQVNEAIQAGDHNFERFQKLLSVMPDKR